MELKYYSLLFSIVGIAVLYVLSLLVQPTVISLQDLPQYEGKQVIVQGTVIKNYQTIYGSHLITLKENHTTATVFVEGSPSFIIEYGDTIQAEGAVQQYEDEWEIVVDDEKHISLLQKWQNVSFPLWQLAGWPERYKDTNVNVTGYVDVIYDTYFYLIDKEEKHSIVVFCASPTYGTLFPGKEVSVAATFIFDECTFRYALDVCKESHGIFFSQEEDR
ncbi:MAG: hypothetical protein JW771_03040 [Candidatus Thermoplasmatota archaeon]|nr:hypothetical protein [Candidatus Thermoplasmatota archaeon]